MSAEDQIRYWARMLDEAFGGPEGINETPKRELDRERTRREKARDRMAANAGGGAEAKAAALCGVPGLMDVCGGKYKKFIIYDDRVIVLARLNGDAVVPFYCSTGLSGKSRADAKAGRWFAFWGLGPDGWFNKMQLVCDDDPSASLVMSNQYGNRAIKKMADVLDRDAGDVAGAFAGMKSNKVGLERARGVVNQFFDYEPCSWKDRHDPESVLCYLNNMASVFSRIKDRKAIDKLAHAGDVIGVKCFKGEDGGIEFTLPPFARW